jgi:hypothetical protein
MPTPAGDEPNRIQDLSRDLQNIARGDAQAPGEFKDDLVTLTSEKPDALGAAQAMADRTAAAVTGASLPTATADQLAQQLWFTFKARTISERQITQLQSDVRNTLTSAGAGPDKIQPVVDQVAEVQKALNEAPRRWYQLF